MKRDTWGLPASSLVLNILRISIFIWLTMPFRKKVRSMVNFRIAIKSHIINLRNMLTAVTFALCRCWWWKNEVFWCSWKDEGHSHWPHPLGCHSAQPCQKVILFRAVWFGFHDGWKAESLFNWSQLKPFSYNRWKCSGKNNSSNAWQCDEDSNWSYFPTSSFVVSQNQE